MGHSSIKGVRMYKSSAALVSEFKSSCLPMKQRIAQFGVTPGLEIKTGTENMPAYLEDYAGGGCKRSRAISDMGAVIGKMELAIFEIDQYVTAASFLRASVPMEYQTQFAGRVNNLKDVKAAAENVISQTKTLVGNGGAAQGKRLVAVDFGVFGDTLRLPVNRYKQT